VMAACTLVVMQGAVAALHLNEMVARTMGIITFSIASIFFALETNDQLRSIFSRETLESRKLIQMSGLALLAIFLITKLDFLNRIFATSDLSLGQWLICIAVSALVILVGEIVKIFRRRAERSSEAESESLSTAQTAA